MPCNNTSMMLPLGLESTGSVGGGVLQLPLIQPHSPGKNGPAPPGSPPMKTPGSPSSMANAAAIAAQNAVNQQQQNQQSSRYKTELCRPFEEFNVCKYGDKCQFAHGFGELRRMTRHPKYKTELCRTFHTLGLCPYGHRCHFIHNSDEVNTAATGNRENGGASNGAQATKDPVAHRSSSMSSSASTSSNSSSTSGLGSGGSSPVYAPHPHVGSPFSAQANALAGNPLGSEADLYAAAAASGLGFGQMAIAAQAQLVAAAQAQLALNVAAQAQQLPPLSPSQSPSFCGSSIPSLSSSPPLSAGGNNSPGSQFYAPINYYLETNHRLPVFWNLSP